MTDATLASRAVASGQPAIARSFRFHRPRGPVCGRGYCWQCECVTPAGRVLACEAPADPVKAHLPPRDLLRPAGRVAEAWPPWFYERRGLRSEAQRRFFLHALRHLSAAASLGRSVRPHFVKPFEEEQADVLVVGSAAHAPAGARIVDLVRGELALGIYPGRVLGVLTEQKLLAISFERLILATGSYDRLPPILGNDLPGLIGLKAAQRYAAAGGLRPGTRVAVWSPASGRHAVEKLAESAQLEVVWFSERAPIALAGKGHVERLEAETAVACDLFITAVAQPAIELALQAGAPARLTTGELPILTVAETPPWLELTGAASRRSSEVPDVRSSDKAFACLCEDVRVKDVRGCAAQGFGHPELVKRRTGAMTGSCQGKLCAAAVLSVLREEGIDVSPTTARPLSRPVTLAELAADA